MSLLHPNIRSLTVHDSDETAFGVAEESYDGRDVRCVTQPNAELTQDWIENPTVRQRIAHVSGGILGLKRGKLSMATFLRGTGTAAGSATASLGYADLAEGQFLRNALGGESLGTGSTVAADPEPSTTGCTATSAAGLSVGQAIMINGEVTVIASKNTNAITFTRALSAAPEALDVIYAAATYYPVQALTHTLQFQIKGAEDDYWSLLGCQLTMKIAQLGMGQLPQAVYEAMVANWAAHTGAAIDNDSYSNVTNPTALGYASALYVQDHGTTTRNLVDADAISIDPGLAVEAIGSASGVMGIQKYTRSAAQPVVEFTTEYSDDWRDDFDAQTAKYLHLQIGSTAGQTTLIEVPKFYLNKSVERNPYNSQLGSKVSGVGRDDTAAGATDLLQAAIRVHLL